MPATSGVHTYKTGHQGIGTAFDIGNVESDLKRMKDLAESLQQHAIRGSDDALEAGFDPSTRVDELTDTCQSLKSQAGDVEKAVDQTRKAFESLVETRRIDGQEHPNDEAARRGACVRVVRTLVESPSRFHTLLRALGVNVTQEIKEALDNALGRELSDSQTDQWLHETQETRRRDRDRTEALEAQLQQLEKDVAAKGHTIDRLYRERNEALYRADDRKHRLNISERESSRAKQERDRLRREARTDQENMEADKLTMRQLERRNLTLIGQIEMLTQEKSDANARAVEAESKVQGQEAELSSLRRELATFRLREPRTQETEATIRALRLAVANATEDAVGSGQRLKTVHEYNLDFRAENRSLSQKNERLERELAQARQRISSLQSDNTTLSSQNQYLEEQVSAACDLTAVLTDHTAELRGEKDGLELEISNVRGTSDSERRRALQDLESATARANEAEKRGDELHERVEQQCQELNDQVNEITRLTRTSQEREVHFSRQSEAQVQQAATLLRYLSIGTESDIWLGLAQQALGDSTQLEIQTTWHPWRILPSWSTDAALDVSVDDRSVHAAALDVLATLSCGSANAENLLSRLQVLQRGLIGSPMVVSSMANMLLESFVDAVQDTRLHLMHRLAMWQVVLEMFPAARAQETLGEALDRFDVRIVFLADKMRGWDSGDPIEFGRNICLRYSDIALLGFGRDPLGVMALNLRDRELRWIDIARIRQHLDEMELVPLTGASIRLPLDNEERLIWALTHA